MRTCPECGTEYGDHVRICPRDGTPFVREEAPTLGAVLDGKYRLESIVGRGAMGTVYRASHVMLGTSLAIKILNPSVAGSPEMVRRFYREARAASQLQHPFIAQTFPFIAQTFDLGYGDDGTLYLAMEFVAGETLRERLGREGGLPPSKAIPFVRQIATALAFAHSRGVIHRDLKPQNIMVAAGAAGRDDVAKLVDFGIAKTFDDAAGLTASGMMIGTPAYMSPEQINGAQVDARSDLYSFGVVIYEMLAGMPPFVGPTTTAVTMKHLHETPEPPSVRTPGGFRSPLLEHIALKLLQKAPEARYQTAGEVLDALDAAPDHRQENEDRRIAVPPGTQVAPRRWQRPVATIGGLLAVGLAGIWVAGFGGSSTPPEVVRSNLAAVAPLGCNATLLRTEPTATVPGTGGPSWKTAVEAGTYELRTVCVDGRTDTRPVKITNADLTIEIDLKARETLSDRAVEGCRQSNPRALGVSDEGRRVFYVASLDCANGVRSSVVMIDRQSDTIARIGDVAWDDLLDVDFGMTRTGSHIAFAATKGLVMVHGVDEGTEQRLEVGDGYYANLTLSDDGRFVTFQPYGSGNARAIWVDRETAKASALPGRIAAVSRDSRWIAASRGRQIVLIERATGAERPLTTVAGDEGLARFVADGKTLFVAAESRSGDFEGRLIQVDTGVVGPNPVIQTVNDLGAQDASVSFLAADGGAMFWIGTPTRTGVPRGLFWLAPAGGAPELVFDKAEVQSVASSSDGAYVVATTRAGNGGTQLLLIDRPRRPGKW